MNNQNQTFSGRKRFRHEASFEGGIMINGRPFSHTAISATNDALIVLENRIESTGQYATELNKDLGDLDGRVETLEEKSNTIEGKIPTIEKGIGDNAGNITTNTNGISALKGRVDDIDTYHLANDKYHESVTKTLEDHSGSLATLGTTVTNHTTVIGNHTLQIEGHDDRLNEAEEWQGSAENNRKEDMLGAVDTPQGSISNAVFERGIDNAIKIPGETLVAYFWCINHQVFFAGRYKDGEWGIEFAGGSTLVWGRLELTQPPDAAPVQIIYYPLENALLYMTTTKVFKYELNQPLDLNWRGGGAITGGLVYTPGSGTNQSIYYNPILRHVIICTLPSTFPATFAGLIHFSTAQDLSVWDTNEGVEDINMETITSSNGAVAVYRDLCYSEKYHLYMIFSIEPRRLMISQDGRTWIPKQAYISDIGHQRVLRWIRYLNRFVLIPQDDDEAFSFSYNGIDWESKFPQYLSQTSTGNDMEILNELHMIVFHSPHPVTGAEQAMAYSRDGYNFFKKAMPGNTLSTGAYKDFVYSSDLNMIMFTIRNSNSPTFPRGVYYANLHEAYIKEHTALESGIVYNEHAEQCQLRNYNRWIQSGLKGVYTYIRNTMRWVIQGGVAFFWVDLKLDTRENSDTTIGMRLALTPFINRGIFPASGTGLTPCTFSYFFTSYATAVYAGVNTESEIVFYDVNTNGHLEPLTNNNMGANFEFVLSGSFVVEGA